MPKTSRPSDASVANATSGFRDADDVTPLDGDDFLALNRANRERHRDEAARKADRDARTPGKVIAASTRRLPTVDRRNVVLAVLAALVVVLAVSTGVLAYAYTQAHREATTAGPSLAMRQSAMDTARQYAAEIATYDPGDYADLDRRIREISTPEFAKTYIASSADARRGNDKARGTSKAVSKEAGLQSISDNQAVVLVTLDQTVTAPDVNAEMPDGIPYQSRVKVTLDRRNGRWLLADLDTV